MKTYSVSDVAVFASGIPHPEGIAFDAAGWLYAGSAAPDYRGAGPVFRVSPDGGRVERFADTGGRVLGVAFDRQGALYVCDSLLGAVFRIAPGGQVGLFADHAGAWKIRLPNFAVFDRKGNLYLSDSGTARAGERTAAVLRFGPDGSGEVWLDGLIFANGLALSAAEDALFVVETRDNRVLRVPIRSDGAPGAPQVYAQDLASGPDGLALDRAGNLYITVTRPSQILVVSPTGERITLLSDPADGRVFAPSNLAFGPPQGQGLYIANLFGHHLSRLVVDEPGMPLYHQRLPA